MNSAIKNTAIPCLLGGAVLGGVALSSSLPVAADELEVSIGNSLVDFRYSGQIRDNFFGKLSLMHSEDDEGRNNADITNNLVGLTLTTQGEREGLIIRLGGRAFFMNMDVDVPVDDSGNSVGLGLGGGITASILPELHASLDSYYAPDLLTLGDIDSTWDTELRLSYDVIESGSVFVGYRILKGELNGDNGDVFNGALIGIRLEF